VWNDWEIWGLRMESWALPLATIKVELTLKQGLGACVNNLPPNSLAAELIAP
jgi:hypothetical protein